MKALVRDHYGGPEVLELRELETPTPQAGEVLVRVHTSSVNTADVDYVLGRPWVARLGTGLRTPRAPIPGIDMAGVVESVGPDATRFGPGDRVFADLFAVGSGAWAEYVAVPESALTSIPEDVSFQSAGASPSAGIFAIQSVRSKRAVKPGERVLVNGASGNVGPFAVQVAMADGAEVTGVCRTDKMEMVRAIGADHVIDHTVEDYRASDERYHLIVDIAGRGGVVGLRSCLEPGGGYVVVGANARGYLESAVLAPLVGLATRRRMGILMWRVNDPQDMAELARMLADGRVRPHIDSTVSLEDVPAALTRVQTGDFRGKIAVAVRADA